MADRYVQDEDPKLVDKLIRTSFNDALRRERRTFLFLSILSSFVAVSKLTPSEISTMGLKFEKLTPSLFYWFLLALVIYSLVSFWLYAGPDFREARKGKKEIEGSRITLYDAPFHHTVQNRFKSSARYSVWLFFEFILPFLVGFLAIGSLLYRILCRA